MMPMPSEAKVVRQQFLPLLLRELREAQGEVHLCDLPAARGKAPEGIAKHASDSRLPGIGQAGQAPEQSQSDPGGPVAD